ncbi:MAG TPA: arsenate reductase ArsC [Fimbriimonadaceae bacterium]
MKTVLFVCVHNAGRSQMAQAFTKSMAAERGLEVTALSAGTVGGKSLNPIAVEVMNEIGISMAGQTPKLITEEMVMQADKIISMGCGVDAEACPTRFILAEDWELDDPAGQPIEKVRETRDQIRSRVSALLDECGKS